MPVDGTTRKRTEKGAARPAGDEANPGTMIAPDDLRRVAEEVRSAFPRPLRAPQLVMIDVDPRRLHAFWTVSAAAVNDARRELGEGGTQVPTVLRLSETDDGGEGSTFDVEVVGLQGQCYVDIWGETRRYTATLGLRLADGGLWPLTGPATVELPRLGPADEAPIRPSGAGEAVKKVVPAETAAPTQSEGAAAAQLTPSPSTTALTPRFPQPPSEPGTWVDPAPSAPLAAALASTLPTGFHAPSPAATVGAGAEPAKTAHHPFALPPEQPGEWGAEALLGGWLPSNSSEPSGGGAVAEPVTGGERAAGAVNQPGPESADQPQALPLENVLTVSSYVLGRELVDLEINAELHVFGRARPGTRLQLFGRPVRLRPDGTFSITRPLPNGALVLSSLLTSDEPDPIR